MKLIYISTQIVFFYLFVLQELVDHHRKNREPKVMFSFVPLYLVSSLKFVQMKSPILGYEGEIKLIAYFLKNSRILEKLSLRFENYYRKKSKYVILKELLAIPRCSSACKVDLLWLANNIVQQLYMWGFLATNNAVSLSYVSW